MIAILADLAQITHRHCTTLTRWIAKGKLQASRWGYTRKHKGWLTSSRHIRIAEANNWTDKQLQANKVANQLIREFGLERVE